MTKVVGTEKVVDITDTEMEATKVLKTVAARYQSQLREVTRIIMAIRELAAQMRRRPREDTEHLAVQGSQILYKQRDREVCFAASLASMRWIEEVSRDGIE